MLDLTKPVQTRRGDPARVICKNRVGKYPIIALVGPHELVYGYTPQGEFEYGALTDADLVNVPEPHAEVRRAFEAGYPIQYSCHHTGFEWKDCRVPTFKADVEYRLKPY
jgi:hypothetical protein